MKDSQVVVIGSLNYDLILKQERLPQKGETFTAYEMIQGPGGKGANQAAQCAKLGLSTVMVGKVGQDKFGEELIDSLLSTGVDVSNIGKEGTTGMGIVNVLPDGDYHSTLLQGANYRLSIADIDPILSSIQNSQYVLLQQEIPPSVVEYILEQTKDLPCRIVLNNAPARDIELRHLSSVDILVVNETEAEYMSHQPVDSIEAAHIVAEKLVNNVKEMVILTMGAIGVVVATKEGTTYSPANKVDAVDATGAGDSFIGAFVFGLINNYSLQETIKLATLVSSITVSKTGGSDSFPTLSELDLQGVTFRV